MKAAFIQQPGPATSITYDELPDPTPGPGQILLQVEAVSVNPIDTYIRSGKIAMDLPSPFVVGCDFAGKVIGLGAGVAGFNMGDRVWGSNQGLLGRQGTFAEQMVVDAPWVYPIPASIGFEDAAAVALVAITAHLGLFAEAKLQAGQTIFVRGGTGGVGSMVLQMARITGARIITTAGSDEKAAQCKALGADAVICHHREPTRERLKELAPEGVSVWWETLREPDFDLAIDALAPRGCMILMAGREARPSFPVGPFYVKQCRMHGFVMFGASPEDQSACAQDIHRWMGEGKLKAHIDRVLPLSDTAEAHRLQEANTLEGSGVLAGKIVLKP
ncbi:NADPH:quinone reductase [Verrucomicrobia bacterium]|nr:NADPH:quinone reductase [Verrucomicrobiota bacterium]MDG1892206.1 NADPH:quinone reductase [Verrucomicrobiota bacterium]